jgi:hypothetical protein
VAERVPLLVNRNAFNNSYLEYQGAKLGHMMTPLAELRGRTANCKRRAIHKDWQESSPSVSQTA